MRDARLFAADLILVLAALSGIGGILLASSVLGGPLMLTGMALGAVSAALAPPRITRVVIGIGFATLFFYYVGVVLLLSTAASWLIRRSSTAHRQHSQIR